MVEILVLDDEKDLLEMVGIILSAEGMKVTPVSNVPDFFTKLSDHSPDIILMDIHIGVEDGREICFQMKNSSKFSTIPIVLYSADSISQSSITASLADSFVEKPFSIKCLSDALYKHLK